MFVVRLLPNPSALLLSGLVCACGGKADDPGKVIASGGAFASGGASTSGVSSGGGFSSGGALSTGGAASTGGRFNTGGMVGSSGAETGGAGSGGAPGGGTMSGGAASGGAASGGEGPGGDAAGGDQGSGGAASEAFVLSSSSWDASVVDNDDCSEDSRDSCPLYPQENVSSFIGGDNLSPDMSWPAGPDDTKSYAIVLHDLVYMRENGGTTHWGVFDIPADANMLAEGLPSGTLSDPAGAKQVGIQGPAYFGSGACGNVYEFRLYALSVETIGSPATPADLRTTLLGSSDVLAQTFVRLQSRDYCAP